MSRSTHQSNFYDFGSFRIDAANRLLLQGGEIISLQPKTFDILLLLIENRGRVLDKEELMRRVWPDTAVEESNLTQNIYVLRKIFSADAGGQKYIETLPRRGYRFVAPVSEASEILITSEAFAQPATPLQAETAAAAAQPDHNERRTDRAAINQSSDKQAHFRRARAGRLKWLLLVFFVLLGLGGVAYFLNRRPPIQAIAVLPFVPLNGDADQEYLGLGIADDLITRLSSTRQIVVRPMSLVIRAKASMSALITCNRR